MDPLAVETGNGEVATVGDALGDALVRSGDTPDSGTAHAPVHGDVWALARGMPDGLAAMPLEALTMRAHL